MRVPLARYGIRELVVFGGGSLAVAVFLILVGWGWLSPIFLLLFVAILWFFRDPERRIPGDERTVVSPADGKVVAITEVENEEFLDCPATRIDIFLAVYNVHVNRVPLAGEVRYLKDREGPYMSALNLDAGHENKARSVGFLSDVGAFPFLVRQIVGAVARRIVTPVGLGDRFARGDRFGMIKFGSRTQFSIPRDVPFELRVKLGDTVQGGATVLGVVGKMPGEQGTG